MKIAVSLSDRVESAGRTVADMLEAQRHEPDCEVQILQFAFGSIGLLGRPDEASADWPLWRGADGSFLVFTGLPIVSSGSTPGPLPASHPAVKAALAAGDADKTVAALGEIDGAFACFWWSASRGEFTVLTDFLGMQPLYRATGSGMTCFASEIKAFSRAGVLPVQADAGAWAAMLYFGHQIGERTMLAGVRRVAPAHAITFTSPIAECSKETWLWPIRKSHRSDSLIYELGEAIRADVRAYATAFPDAALLLSGGFDSRLILCLCRELGLKPRLLTQDHPDENANADARFGYAFASLVGMSTKGFPARADYYSTTDYLRFLTLNEVATPSLNLFIATVPPVVRPERQGVWEGLLLDPALKFDYGNGGFAEYLKSRIGARRRELGKVVHKLFSASWAERMDAEFDSLLVEERSRFSDDAHGVWRFSVLNRSRFRTGINPYQVFDTSTPPLTPGMSKRFWELASAADPEARYGKKLYREVFQHLAPRGLDIPVATGSSLMRGNGSALLFQSQRILAAIQRLAQRPRVTQLLRSFGVPTPFAWTPSRYLHVSRDDSILDDSRLNADWIRLATGNDAPNESNALDMEVLMYWRAWHQLMYDDLMSAWADHI